MLARTTTAEDEREIAARIAVDPDHAGRVKPEFFSTPPKGSECFVAETSCGESLFCRADNCLRLHIQFGSSALRTAKALREFIPWIEGQARKSGYTQIIWESSSEPLIKMAARYGYRKSANEVVLDIHKGPS